MDTIIITVNGSEIELFDRGRYYVDEDGNEYRECYECGEVMPYEDMYETEDGEYICYDCMCVYYRECDRCGSLVRNDETHRVNEDERWCGYCADNYARACGDCGELYDTFGLTYVSGGYEVCYDCLSENYSYCGGCGEYVHYDHYNYDAGICYECARELSPVREYHDAPDLYFYGKMLNSRWRRWHIGVELEIDRDDYNCEYHAPLIEELNSLVDEWNDELYYEHDGSLKNGFEIISQPHTEQAFYNMDWENILKACRDFGYKSHDARTCGLHLHISRELFGRNKKSQARAIAKVMLFYELYYNEMVKASRRDANGLGWARLHGTSNPKTLKDKALGKTYNDRYTAVNINNYDTVEFRLMRGTLNYDSFMACVDLTITIAKNSRYVTWKNATNVNAWLKGIKAGTLEYLKKRGAFAGYGLY